LSWNEPSVANIEASPADENGFALLTGMGRGAVGVVWIKGSRAPGLLTAHFRPAGNSPLAARPLGSITYGVWMHAAGNMSAAEDVVVVKLAAEEFEVHIHGGRQSRESLSLILSTAGFRELTGSEWLRSHQASELGACVAEELLRCETERAARWLLNQERAWRKWYELVAQMSAESEFAGVIAACDAVLQRTKVARHLTEPWVVVLGGEPNVGKSSLINALAGFTRAIVHSSPGTTRDVVTQRLVLDGWLVELVDTAGQRVAGSAIEASGIERALEVWRAADCRIAVRDATRPCDSQPVDWQPLPDLQVANKSDLLEAEVRSNCLAVSALTGSGLDQLQRAIVQVLVPDTVSEGMPLPLGGVLPEILEGMSRAASVQDRERLERGLLRMREYCGLSTGACG
jgi:tRNA modification GTPase